MIRPHCARLPAEAVSVTVPECEDRSAAGWAVDVRGRVDGLAESTWALRCVCQCRAWPARCARLAAAGRGSSQRQGVRRSKSQHECSMCLSRSGCTQGPGHHTPNVVARQRSSVSKDGTTARIGGKRSVERLGKVAGGILLALGSVGGVPAIGQMIGSDDDKPVVVVVQQDQPAGQERPADQPTVGCRLWDPCRSRGQVGSREPIWCLSTRGGPSA